MDATIIVCEHKCGICDADALVFDTWDGPDAWWHCTVCDEGHTSRDCCSPQRANS